MKQGLLVILCLFILSSCKNSTEKQTDNPNSSKTSKAEITAQKLEQNHHIDRFKANKAIAFQLKIQFENDSTFKAKISLNTDLNKIRVELRNGTTLIYDGKTAGLFPKNNYYKTASTDLWTWANLFALPFEVKQHARGWKLQSPETLNNTTYNRLAVNFDHNPIWPNQGWSTVYSSPSTGFIQMATFTSLATQQTPTQVVIYKDYFSLHEVPIAKHWEIYNWLDHERHLGKKIAEAEISQVKFIIPSKDYFKIQKQSHSIN